jgi:hypothetical protein
MWHRRLALALILLLCCACGDKKSPTSPSTPAPLTTPTTPTLTSVTVQGTNCANEGVCELPGDTLQLSATARYSDGTSSTVTNSAAWTSTAPSVATVTTGGLVTSKSTGTSDVLATYQGKSGGVTIRVSAPWTKTGSGNSVFDMPTYVSRVRITGTYTGYGSNFIVRIAGRTVVNEILGQTSIGIGPQYDGTHLTNGGTVEITNSSGVAWSFTQVRQ